MNTGKWVHNRHMKTISSSYQWLWKHINQFLTNYTCFVCCNSTCECDVSCGEKYTRDSWSTWVAQPSIVHFSLTGDPFLQVGASSSDELDNTRLRWLIRLMIWARTSLVACNGIAVAGWWSASCDASNHASKWRIMFLLYVLLMNWATDFWISGCCILMEDEKPSRTHNI